jgi:hypothetical protein
MLKFTSLLLVIIISTNIFSQKKSIKKAAEDACECLSELNLTSTDIEGISILGQTCIEQAITDNFERIVKDFKLDPENITTEDGYLVGTNLTEELINTCQTYVDLVILINESVEDEIFYEDTNYTEYRDEPNTLIGELVGIKVNDFVYVYIEDASGEVHEFIWMTPLKNSTNFEINGETLLGEQLIISWEQIEMYTGEVDGYQTRKLLIAAQ